MKQNKNKMCMNKEQALSPTSSERGGGEISTAATANTRQAKNQRGVQSERSACQCACMLGSGYAYMCVSVCAYVCVYIIYAALADD